MAQTRNKRWRVAAVAAVAMAAVGQLHGAAADDAFDVFADANPAVFTVADGKDLWSEPRGPNHVSLEQCDLGLGPGKVKGAYAQLPRYFEDAGRVMDAQTRLVYCMVYLQGMARDKILANAYSPRGGPATPLEALTAFVASKSRGDTIAVPQSHPAEKRMYQIGKALFWYRMGTHDFSCASCHRASGKRVRLTEVPNLTTNEGARASFSTWPAYRKSHGTVRTMEHRLRGCMRQQRVPVLKAGSKAATALITYMGVMANGGTMQAPGFKR